MKHSRSILKLIRIGCKLFLQTGLLLTLNTHVQANTNNNERQRHTVTSQKDRNNMNYYPAEQRYQRIKHSNFIVKRFTQFEQNLPRNPFNKAFIYLTVFFIITMIVIIILIYIIRFIMLLRDNERNHLRSIFWEEINEYLYNEKPINEVITVFKSYNSNFCANVFIDEIMKLSLSLKGESLKQLRNIYLAMDYNIISVNKLKSPFWSVRIRGIHELSQMRIKDGNDIIINLLNHKHKVVRTESQLALIRLLPMVPFAFMDSLKQPFTVWEQVNVHELLLSNEVEQPDFALWLNLENETVVEFALNMIAINKVTENIQMVQKMLDHPNENIQSVAIYALGTLGQPETEPALIAKYQTANMDIKIAILEALAKIGNPANIDFFINTMKTEPDYFCKLACCKGIKNTGIHGESILYEQQNIIKDDEILLACINHVLDDRI